MHQKFSFINEVPMRYFYAFTLNTFLILNAKETNFDTFTSYSRISTFNKQYLQDAMMERMIE